MRTIVLTLITLILSFITVAQDQTTVDRKGFVIGLGIGGGAISIADSNTQQNFDKGQAALSLPNLKLGYMLNSKTALLLTTSGIIYQQEQYDRSFETLLPSVQYWVSDNWWINGGLGLAVDMPALYDIKKGKNDTYNYGCGLGLSAGYELMKKDNCTLDLQIQTTMGRVFFKGDGHRDAATIAIGIGFNWY